jgi:apolipoprotein N-acyltransferase
VSPLLRWPSALASAVLGGVALWASFPPMGLGYLSPIAVALIAAAVYQAKVWRGFIMGVLAGWSAFLPMLVWLQVVGPDAWFLLATLCAAWVGLFGMASSLITRLPQWPLWVVGVAACWVLVESLRSRYPWGGFAWGRLGFAQPDTVFGPTAPLVGMAGTSFLVAVTGTLFLAVMIAVRSGPRRAAVTKAVAFGLVAMTVIALGLVLPQWARSSAAQTTRVAIVQGGTPQLGMGAMDVRRAVLQNHIDQTVRLAAAVENGQVPRPDVVLWPENSSDIDPFIDADAGSQIMQSARLVGAPILVGAVLEVPEDPTRIRNAAVEWDPIFGADEIYIKRHLVPFGEFVPYRDALAQYIDRLDRVSRDFAPGDVPGNMTVGGVPLGVVICFEVSNDSVVRDVVAQGAEIIAVLTNNATFGGSAQPEQQLQIERMRAMEMYRIVAVAATSGISAVIGPEGEILEELGESETGFLVAEVPREQRVMPAVFLGGWIEGLLGLIALGALVLGAALRSRPAGERPSELEPPRTVG